MKKHRGCTATCRIQAVFRGVSSAVFGDTGNEMKKYVYLGESARTPASHDRSANQTSVVTASRAIFTAILKTFAL